MSKRRTDWIVALTIVLVIAVPIVTLFVAPITYAPLLERAVRAGTGLQPRVATLEVIPVSCNWIISSGLVMSYRNGSCSVVRY